MVGDRVRITPQSSEHEGALKKFCQENTLIRPPVANIDNLAVVVAAEQPSPDFYMVDKLIITAERMGISVILLINKIDLAKTDVLKKMKSQYSDQAIQYFAFPANLAKG